MVITPGLNKYKQGYNAPFDKHRDLANDHIKRCSRLCVVGYGFNDDHLQVHLRDRLKAGIPALILNRSVTPTVIDLVNEAPGCVCVSMRSGTAGITIHTQNKFEDDATAPGIWDIGTLAEEVL